MNKSYYVDTCIYLNLWWKEEIGSLKVWRYAKDFLENAESNHNIIYYSGYILKELLHKLSKEEFDIKKEMFEFTNNYKKITMNEEEYEKARKIEKEIGVEISFFDIIHMLLAKKTNSILVTRDNKLIKVAEKYGVKALKPEQL
jgi:predicted nucleic acid-binding protein